MNIAIKNLMNRQNIVIDMRILKIGWPNQIKRMVDQRLTKNVHKWKRTGSRRVGRPNMRRGNVVMRSLKINWRDQIIRMDSQTLTKHLYMETDRE